MSVSEGGVEGSFWIVLAGLSSRFVFRSWREIPVLVDWGFAIFVRYSFIVFGGWRREEGWVCEISVLFLWIHLGNPSTKKLN